MNKKGFTVIELLASFSLAISIFIILFNVVLIIKDDYQDIKDKTNLLVNKNNLSYIINEQLKNNTLTSLTTCDDHNICYLFTYEDNNTDKLIYDSANKVIRFHNFTFEVDDTITLGDINIKEYYDQVTTSLDGYFIINIPITQNKKDYSIKVIYQFNTDNVFINI